MYIIAIVSMFKDFIELLSSHRVSTQIAIAIEHISTNMESQTYVFTLENLSKDLTEIIIFSKCRILLKCIICLNFNLTSSMIL